MESFIIGFIIGVIAIIVIALLLNKEDCELYNDGHEQGYIDGLNDSVDEEQFSLAAKKVVSDVLDEKINHLKEDKGFSSLETIKLQNIKNEICVALDDEFSPKQRA